MKLQRQKAGHPNDKKLGQMLSALRDFLNKRKSFGLSLQSLLDFQDEDGSFNLLDSYEVPGEAALDFCHNPTYLGAAILMRELLSGVNNLNDPLERALKACLPGRLLGQRL